MMNKTLRHLLALCIALLLISATGVSAFADETPSANIPISFKTEGNVPEKAEPYTVEITPDKAGYPMPAESKDGAYRVEITGEASGSIVIPITRVGMYGYTVKQVPGENEGCIYDSTVYKVTVLVTYAKEGGLDVSVTARKDGATGKSDIAFTNYYSQFATMTVGAVKTLDGKTPDDGAFSFQLTDEDGNVVETAKNVGRDVTFKELVFEKTGTYTYTLKEVKGSKNNISYDTAVYTAVIEVVRNEENDYEATLTYKKDGSAYTGTPVFANKTVPSLIPQTGDTTPIFLLAAVMLLSAGAICLLLFKAKKNKENRDS